MKKSWLYFLFFPLCIYAQQESYYSLYQYNMQIINPAFAGAEAEMTATVLNRNQWSILEDAPKTTAFSFSSERANNVGLGLSVVSDKVFVEKQTFAYVDFSYKLELANDAKVFLGLKAGGNFYTADGIDLRSYGTEIDPAQKMLSRFNPNVGVGAYLQSSSYWVSFSIPRLFNVRRDSDLYIAAKDRTHTYLGVGGQLNLSERFIFKPSLMFRKVKGLPLNADITGFLSIKNRMDFGISYRTKTALSYMVYINVFNGIDIGYAYETPSEARLSGMSLKTHEVILRFRLGDNVVKTENQGSSLKE